MESTTDIPDPFDKPVSPRSQSTSSWTDLQRAVKNTRKLNYALSNKVLTGFTFRHVYSKGGHVSRIYFLGVPNGGFMRDSSNTLLYVDVPNNNVENSNETKFKPEWHQLLEYFQNSSQSFSKEEQLLRERKRLGSFGITSYDVDINSGKFLFPACSTLFVCQDSVHGDQLVVCITIF